MDKFISRTGPSRLVVVQPGTSEKFVPRRSNRSLKIGCAKAPVNIAPEKSEKPVPRRYNRKRGCANTPVNTAPDMQVERKRRNDNVNTRSSARKKRNVAE